jgi:hypothetical protein
VSYESKKGYAAEHSVLLYLGQIAGGLYRPRAGSVVDVGDIAGLPFVVSVKNHHAIDLASWTHRLKGMVADANLQTGFVFHKKVGKSDPGEWYCTTTGALMVPFLRSYMESQRGGV